MKPRRPRKPKTATKPTPKKPSLDRKPRGGKSESHGETAGAGDASPEERRRGEQDRLVEWAQVSGRIVAASAIQALTLISNSTSEHEVWRGPASTHSLKPTWPGSHGQIPEPKDVIGKRWRWLEEADVVRDAACLEFELCSPGG
jgi:hypothetical protein